MKLSISDYIRKPFPHPLVNSHVEKDRFEILFGFDLILGLMGWLVKVVNCIITQTTRSYFYVWCSKNIWLYWNGTYVYEVGFFDQGLSPWN